MIATAFIVITYVMCRTFGVLVTYSCCRSVNTVLSVYCDAVWSGSRLGRGHLLHIYFLHQIQKGDNLLHRGDYDVHLPYAAKYGGARIWAYQRMKVIFGNGPLRVFVELLMACSNSSFYKTYNR